MAIADTLKRVWNRTLADLYSPTCAILLQHDVIVDFARFVLVHAFEVARIAHPLGDVEWKN